jgi:hypothetical protein
MLRPPYNRKELERALAVELQAARALLAPALEDLAQCQVDLRERGFLADEPYRILFDSAEERFRSDCLEQCEGGDPGRISLADLIELYPDRMLQPMHDFPTARSRYRACIGDALWKKAKDELDIALKERWLAFVAEANRYSDMLIQSITRAAILEKMLKESLAEAGFRTFTVSRKSVAKWHPRPSWVDAVAGAMTNDELEIIMLVETPRPLKYNVIPNYSSEPDERDTGFDKVNVSTWALPRRRIPEFGAAALKIRNSLLLYYWDFYSAKGLRRIIDAHVEQARITMIKLD